VIEPSKRRIPSVERMVAGVVLLELVAHAELEYRLGLLVEA